MPDKDSAQRLQKLLKLGLRHQREGRPQAAEECYRQALQVDPSCLEAQRLLNLARGSAAASLREPLKLRADAFAETPETLTARAKGYVAEGRLQAAVECFERVVALRPEATEAHLYLGAAQEQSGNLPAAVESYRRVIELRPDSVDGYCHLARVLYRRGEAPAASELYQRALALEPNRYDIYTDLGLVLTNLGNFGAAMEAFRRSLKLNLRCAKTIAGLGYLFERKGDLISASEAYRDAIKLDPALFPAYVDLGFVLYGLGEIAEAAETFERLRALQPDSAEAAANLGMIHLLQGNLTAGWPEYEARRKLGVGDERRLTQPRWKGEPLAGKRILLHAEQGFGDTLQFVRYVPMVAALGGEVVLEVQPGLERLLSRTEGASCVLSRSQSLCQPLPEPMRKFDWQCSLPSLPLAFRTEMHSIPATVPYVFPDPSLVGAWAQRLQGSGRRIGLVWGGNPGMERNRLRSIPLELLAPLIKAFGGVLGGAAGGLPGTTFYSLQVGEASEQLRLLPGDAPVIDLASELKDWAETAAAIANLDLVISVETSVAHLAGAMGRPLWVMLNKGCDWRWFLEREDSPWYPTARLFRQSAVGQWADVVNRIEQELRKGVSGESPALR